MRTEFGRWTAIVTVALVAVMIFAGCEAIDQGIISPTEEPVATFAQGVTVDGVALGGMTLEQGKEAVETAQQSRIDAICITISDGTNQVQYDSKNAYVVASFDTDEILAQAMAAVPSEQPADSSGTDSVDNLSFETSMTVDVSTLQDAVALLGSVFDVAPINAQVVKFDTTPEEMDNRFTYEDAVNGKKADLDQLWTDIQKKAQDQTWDQPIAVVLQEVEPEITLEYLQSITKKIVRFESTMVKNSNRMSNISLMCKLLSTGEPILPDQVFSINETSGPRTLAGGFLNAPVIVGGNRTEDGIAGGICQVSGTLFNAVARADLEIVEKHCHSYELSYLKRGRDATVDYPNLDLKFKNNTQVPIYIMLFTKGTQVIAEVYGQPLKDGMTIDIDVETLSVTKPPSEPKYKADSEVPVGKQEVVSSHEGLKTQSYRVYKDASGNVIKREKLWLDNYRMSPKEIHMNPADLENGKPKPPATATPTKAPTAPPTTPPTTPPTEAPTAPPTEAPTEAPPADQT